MNVNSIVHKLRDIFRLEHPPSEHILSESDSPTVKDSGMPQNLNKLRDFIYEMEAKVIEAAMECGVTINVEEFNARELAGAAEGESTYKETPAMCFEDILLRLELARVSRFEGLLEQHETLSMAADITGISIQSLRHDFKIGMGEGDLEKDDPLAKLIDVEFKLREKVEELAKELLQEKKAKKSREPG